MELDDVLCLPQLFSSLASPLQALNILVTITSEVVLSAIFKLVAGALSAKGLRLLTSITFEMSPRSVEWRGNMEEWKELVALLGKNGVLTIESIL